MWSYERSRDRFKEGAHGQPQTKKLRQMSLCYPIELAFYCLFVLLFFHYFCFFYFISTFYFSSLCLIFLILFLCLIALFDWFSLFSLYCILIFLLSFHTHSNNAQLLIGYFLFWLSKSYISCHIIVVPVIVQIIFVPYNGKYYTATLPDLSPHHVIPELYYCCG